MRAGRCREQHPLVLPLPEGRPQLLGMLVDANRRHLLLANGSSDCGIASREAHQSTGPSAEPFGIDDRQHLQEALIMTNDPRPLISGLTRSETDASDATRFRALPGAVKVVAGRTMLDDTSGLKEWRLAIDALIERCGISSDASASVAGVSAATLIPGVLQPHAAPAYATLSPASDLPDLPPSISIKNHGHYFVAKQVREWHADAQSRIASLTDARDGWKKLAERSVDVVNSLTADLAEARAQAERLTEELDAQNEQVCQLAAESGTRYEEILALKAAASEPVGWFNEKDEHHGYQQVSKEFERFPGTVPLYAAATAPRAPLTDERIDELNREAQDQGISGIAPSRYLARAIERALGIGAIPGDDAKAVGVEASHG